MEFSLKMEMIAALIVAILMFYHYKVSTGSGVRVRWFWLCLGLSLTSIGVNCLSVWAIGRTDLVPVWLNMLLVSLYYLLICLNVAVAALYLFYLILEHAAGEGHLRRIFRVIVLLFLVMVALVLVNYGNGCLFYFQDGVYQRGPWNQIGYWIAGLELALLLVCYEKYRQTVSLAMKRMMYALPGVSLAVVAFQLHYPNIMMNGMVAALADLIIFISFQSSRIGEDATTGLGNRSAFMEDLSHWLKTKKRFHVVWIKLLNFKEVNQKFGYRMGNEFIYSIAQYLSARPRCSRAYRVGGVSFAILCANESCQDLGRCITEIQRRFETPWQLGDQKYRVSACFADLLWEGQPWNRTQIAERVEYAMAEARKQGVNQRVFFDEQLGAQMERRMFVIEQMGQAIAAKRYQVYYQPVYCWPDKAFCTAEALVRLPGQDGVMISPGEFIPIAEESGLIGDISWIVMEQVCQLLSQRRDLPLQAISVNLSMQQFMDDDMEERLEQLLRRYQIDHHRLKIEITERTIAQHPERVRAMMMRMIQRGIGFYLDDFGVGYSNFSLILSLPFETIKLDKSLTDQLLGEERQRQLVQSMVKVFSDAGYRVVAEGAEDAATVEALKAVGVKRIQGFYYAKPQPKEQLLELLRQTVK